MKCFPSKSACLAAVFCIAFQSAVWAASPASLSDVRFHSGRQHDRIVFDWSEMPGYKESVADDGKCITLTFREASAPKWRGKGLSSDLVEKITHEEKNGRLIVKIFLRERAQYKVDKLKNPARIFVDVMRGNRQTKPSEASSEGDGLLKKERPKEEPTGKDPEKNGYPGDMKPGPTRDFSELELAPGLKKTIYSRWNSDGPVEAFFIEADKSKYQVKPALDKGQVIGRESVSRISQEQHAVAAVNASYFDRDGVILGMLKIDGTMAGTTYMRRTAMGIKEDGSVIFGYPYYSAQVTLGDVSWPVSGVDAERGENGLVLYNRWYGPSTRTNEYGLEFTVKKGKVAAIRTNNTPIPEDGVVVSVHGTAMDAFRGVRVGDPVEIEEDMGAEWNRVTQIVGAGPRLIEDGRIQVTAGAEEFPSDIRYGRAPRSAFGITKEGNYVLAVVDGRQSSSHGCTLTEWAQLLRQYGCVEAMNFDGGGSSALVINGELQNSPSDGTERGVASALVLLEK